LGQTGKGFIMKNTNQIPKGPTIAGNTVNPARDENKPASVDTLVAEIHIQANSVGPVLEEILKAGHALVSAAKPTKF
jgi:hypothetical protein